MRRSLEACCFVVQPGGYAVPACLHSRARRMRRKEARGDQGVTLVGLVVVIVVLATLVTAVLLGVGITTRSTRHELALPTRAAFVSCRSTVAAVKAGLQVYRAETLTGSYPPTLADLAAAGQANGPVLKQAPQTAADALTKDGWALVSYDRAPGTFEVATARGPTRPTGTPTVCKGA